MRPGSVVDDRSQLVHELGIQLSAARERAVVGGRVKTPPPPRALEATSASAQRLVKRRGGNDGTDSHGEISRLFRAFYNAIMGMDERVHSKLTTLVEFIEAPEHRRDPCVLRGTSLEILVFYLDQWALEVTTENIVGADGLLLPGAVRWVSAWSGAVEYASRAPVYALGVAGANSLASTTERVLKTITNNLRSLSSSMARSRSKPSGESGLDTKHAAKICDWLTLCTNCVPHCLVALKNVGGSEILAGFEVLRVLSSLEAPLGSSPDVLRVQTVALTAVKAYIGSGLTFVSAELSRNAVATMPYIGLMPWEEFYELDARDVDESERLEVLRTVGSLKRQLLGLFGEIAGMDKDFSSAIASNAGSTTRVVDAITYYEGLRIGGELMKNELLVGVVAFCWGATIPRTNVLMPLTRDRSSLRRGSLAMPQQEPDCAEAYAAAEKLFSILISSLTSRSSFRVIIEALSERVLRGEVDATFAFFKQTDAIQKLLNVALSDENQRLTILTDVLPLVSSIAAFVPKLVPAYLATLLRTLSKLSIPPIDAQAAELVASVLRNLVSSVPDDMVKEVTNWRVLESLAEVTKSLASVEKTNERDGKGLSSERQKALEGVLLLVKAVVSRLAAPNIATKSREECRSVVSLLNYAATVRPAANYVVMVLCSVEPELSTYFAQEEAKHSVRSKYHADLVRGDGSATLWSPLPVSNDTTPKALPNVSKPASAEMPMPEDLADQLAQKQMLMEQLLTTLTRVKELEGILAILDAVRQIASAESLMKNSRLAFKIGLRDSLVFMTVSRPLTMYDSTHLGDEKFGAVAHAVLRTLHVLLRQPPFRRLQPGSLEELIPMEQVSQELIKRVDRLTPQVYDALLTLASDAGEITVDSLHSEEERPKEVARIGKPGISVLILKLARVVKSRTVQTECLQMLNKLSRSSMPNRVTLAKGGTLDIVLEWMMGIHDPRVVELLGELLGYMLEIAITPTQMHCLVDHISIGSKGSIAGHAMLSSLCSALNPMKNPPAMFDLSGRRTGLLASCSLANYPPSRGGYAFSMWFLPESLLRPRTLFCVFDDQGAATEVGLFEDALVLRFRASKKDSHGLDSVVRIDNVLEVGKWTYFALSHHAPSMFARASELTVFLNGRIVASKQLRYPRYSSSVASVAIGISSSAPASTAFRGQIGAFYAFSDALKDSSVGALYNLGPSFDSDLQTCDLSLLHKVSMDESLESALTLYDHRLADKIILLLSPCAADERTCPDNCPGGASGARQPSTAKLLGTEGATRVLLARSARQALEAIGGLRPVLMLFASLDKDVSNGDSPQENVVSPVEMCLRTLTALLRGEDLSQLAAVRHEAYALAAMLVEDSSPRNLTTGAVEAVVDAMHVEILQHFGSVSNPDAVSTAIRQAIPLSKMVDACRSCRDAGVRKKLIFICIKAILTKGLVDKRDKEIGTRLLFHLLDGLSVSDGDSAGNDFLKAFVSLREDEQRDLVLWLRAGTESTLAAALAALDSPNGEIRDGAIAVAFIIVRSKSSSDWRGKVIGAVHLALSSDGPIDINTHQLLLRLSLGDERLGISRHGLEELIPLMFHTIARDPDTASQATALRALVNDAETNESHIRSILSWSLWPRFLATMIEENRACEDESLVQALGQSVDAFVAVIVRCSLRNDSMEDFMGILATIVCCDDPDFSCQAMTVILGVIDRELFSLSGVIKASHELEARRNSLLARLGSVVLSVELLLNSNSSENVQRSIALASRALQSTRLAGAWLDSHAPHSEVASLGQRNSSSSSTMSGMLFSRNASLMDHHQLSLESMNMMGGFVRSTLFLALYMGTKSRTRIEEEERTQILCRALAPAGLPAGHQSLVFYAKLTVEEWSSAARARSDVEESKRLERMYNTAQVSWQSHAKSMPPKKLHHDHVAPEVRATELIRDVETWTLESLQTMSLLSTKLRENFKHQAQDFAHEADWMRTWRDEMMERRRVYIQSQEKTDVSAANARHRGLRYAWARIMNHSLIERMLMEKDAHHKDDGSLAAKWRLDPYQDPQSRRWILRWDPFGPDHSDKAANPQCDRITEAEARELKLETHRSTKLPEEVLVNLSRVDEDDDDEPRTLHFNSSSTRDTGGDFKSTTMAQRSWSGSNPVEDEEMDRDSFKQHITDMANIAASAAKATSILSSSPCILVRPLSETQGTLQITRDAITFRPSPTSDRNSTWSGQSEVVYHERSHALSEIEEVHSRRYLLRPCAFEVFLSSKEALFFVLPNTAGYESMSKTLEVQLKRLGHGAKMIRTVKARNLALKEAMHRWKRRHYSNFEYLSILNKLAGRSYNDIAQYPVFPWVLKDYTSQELDLTDARSFRDFTKPIGCQKRDDEDEAAPMGEREIFFRDRYAHWEDPRGVPPFHYGSHYSSAGTVVHFMLRVEPFTSLFLQLQGGLFDLPDRMFASVGGAWKAVTTSHQAVHELVPELFYQPMFARNSNNLPLGTTQDGRHLGDVELPPWANGSPEKFIRLHRAALECEYTSVHLHHWIDLIFGNKQRGREAVESCNVFYYLTYEGAIDMDSLPDDLRQSFIEQIAHFGQTPMQLLRKPHSQRDALVEDASRPERMLGATFDSTESAHSHDPIVWIQQRSDILITIGRSRSLAAHKFLPLPDLYGNPFTFEADIRMVGSDSSSHLKRSRARRVGGAHIAPGTTESALFGLFAVTRNGKVVISGGHWDSSIRCCLSSDAGRPRQVVRVHRDVVSCLMLANDDSCLATGSRDATVMIWDIVWGWDSEKEKERKEIISERPRLVMHGHLNAVVCVAVSTEIGVVVSGDTYGRVLLHSVRDGRLLRELTTTATISRVLITTNGDIVTYSSSQRLLSVYTVNDVRIGSLTVESELSALCISSDGNMIVVGDGAGDVHVLSTWNLMVMTKFESLGPSVTSVALDAHSESAVLVGLRDGRIRAVTLDREVLKLRSSLMEPINRYHG